MRFVDIVLSLPIFFLILIIVAFLGKGDASVVIIAIGLTGWTLACRLVRAEFLKLREADFVQAARALGVEPERIIGAPHAARARWRRSSWPAPSASPTRWSPRPRCRSSASASARPRRAWATCCTNFEEDLQARPILLVYPAVTIVLIVLAASFLGDGLRDALDPRQRVESK